MSYCKLDDTSVEKVLRLELLNYEYTFIAAVGRQRCCSIHNDAFVKWSESLINVNCCRNIRHRLNTYFWERLNGVTKNSVLVMILSGRWWSLWFEMQIFNVCMSFTIYFICIFLSILFHLPRSQHQNSFIPGRRTNEKHNECTHYCCAINWEVVMHSRWFRSSSRLLLATTTTTNTHHVPSTCTFFVRSFVWNTHKQTHMQKGPGF